MTDAWPWWLSGVRLWVDGYWIWRRGQARKELLKLLRIKRGRGNVHARQMRWQSAAVLAAEAQQRAVASNNSMQLAQLQQAMAVTAQYAYANANNVALPSQSRLVYVPGADGEEGRLVNLSVAPPQQLQYMAGLSAHRPSDPGTLLNGVAGKIF